MSSEGKRMILKNWHDKSKNNLPCRIRIVRVHEQWVFLKIVWTRLFGVVVKLASLVCKIEVQTSTSWLHVASHVARNQAVSSERFIHVMDKSETVFREMIVGTMMPSWCELKGNIKEKNEAQKCHVLRCFFGISSGLLLFLSSDYLPETVL